VYRIKYSESITEMHRLKQFMFKQVKLGVWEMINWTVKPRANCFKVGGTESPFGTWSSYVVHIGSLDMARIIVAWKRMVLCMSLCIHCLS